MLNDQAYFIFQNSSDNPVLLNINEIKAMKKMVFGVCTVLMRIQKVSPPIPGYSVQLAREQRLHQFSSPVIMLMLKIDGRPFWGKESITTDYSLVQT